MRQQVHELHRVVVAENDQSFSIPRVDLGEKLAASSAGREDAIIGHRDDGFDLGFARFDHVRGGGVLGAEAEAAAQVDAHARVDPPEVERIAEATVAAS